MALARAFREGNFNLPPPVMTALPPPPERISARTNSIASGSSTVMILRRA